jgi:hypothetical protein
MEGLIFIPDISGFTNFVKKIDTDLGWKITRELLIEIIESNPLYLEISEIEGDAILFYKQGKPLKMEALMNGFQHIMKCFNKKYRQLRDEYGIEAELSLKLIVHYGELSEYKIKGFTKLFGRAVIEAHRLLKNGSGNNSYMLVTDAYLKALNQDVEDIVLPGWAHSQHERRLFEGVGALSFYYFHYLPQVPFMGEELKDKVA